MDKVQKENIYGVIEKVTDQMSGQVLSLDGRSSRQPCHHWGLLMTMTCSLSSVLCWESLLIRDFVIGITRLLNYLFYSWEGAYSSGNQEEGNLKWKRKIHKQLQLIFRNSFQSAIPQNKQCKKQINLFSPFCLSFK